MSSLKELEIRGSRKEIAERIEKNPEAEKIILETKPSRYVFLLLLNRTKMKKICVSRTIYRSIGRKYWKALEGVGVKIKIEKRGRGRKQYAKKLKNKILKEAEKRGISKTARKYNVGKRSIYYWMKINQDDTA